MQVTVKVIDNNGIQLEDRLFSSLVKPKDSISYIISSLTGITNEDIKNKESIKIILRKFIEFIYHTLTFESNFDKKNISIDKSLEHVQGKTIF